MLLRSFSLLAQDIDEIYFHSGEVAKVDVKRVNEKTVEYNYPNENATLVVSKYAIERIVFRSGRTQEISERYEVHGENDWENVILLYDPDEAVGLKKVQDVLGKTKGFFSGYVSAAGSDRRANEKLLREAAELKCPFVLLVADKDAKGGMQRGSYGSQSIKKGVAYTYEVFTPKTITTK